MRNDPLKLYSDPERYDLVMGAYASGDHLNFYRRQIERHGQPVLELACGSGRFTIPLAKEGVDIIGLDNSQTMLRAAASKALAHEVDAGRFLDGDMRRFDLGRKFKLIFVPAQSLSHLHTREEIEECFACVRRHLAEDGRFVIELFNPSLRLLARESGCRNPAGQHGDPKKGSQVWLSDEVRYDAATQINHIQWFFRNEGSEEEVVLSFEMRQFFPQEIDALLWYNAFRIDHKYGGYNFEEFSSEAWKQLIVCRAE